jgi:hypothetical protein
LLLFVALGLIAVTVASAGSPDWAQPAQSLGTIPIINGTVRFQGRPAAPHPSWSVPVQLTIQCATLPHTYSFSVNTDQSGHFTVDTWTVAGTSKCHLRLKNAHTLRNLKPNVTLVPDGNAIDFGTLLEGDANNNNRVDLVDFSILATSYEKGTGQPGFDPRADFNENHWIEIADFSLLATNYDRSGDITISALANASDETDIQPEPMLLKITPAYHVAGRDDIVMMDIRLDSRGRPFHGAAVYLGFDPTLLEIVDAAGAPVSAIIPGTDLPLVLANSVNSALGQIRLSTGILGEPPAVPTTEFSLGVFYVKAKAASMDITTVNFLVQSYPPLTGITYRGYYEPVTVQNARLRLADTRGLLPLLWLGAHN